MRQGRNKGQPGSAHNRFHCVSRVVNREYIFGPVEREQFVRYMREYEAYCGVRILTHCILSNHFHLLLEVPQKPKEPLSSEQYLKRLSALSSSTITPAQAKQRLAQFRQAGDTAGERAFIDRQCRGMWDLSEFMKRLKQRFTQWYNRRKGRRGTLWEERFRSVLVEGVGESLVTMAAYIDLNPVRAGLVEDPQDYRWCGYAEAAAGEERAREGLRVIVSGAERVEETRNTLEEALAKYRLWLFNQGEERAGTTETGAPLRRGFQREEVLAVIANRGRVERADYLRLKVRYFSDGAVLGSREFVEEIFQTQRHRFGPKRSNGARRLRGLKPELFSVRDLQKNVFS